MASRWRRALTALLTAGLTARLTSARSAGFTWLTSTDALTVLPRGHRRCPLAGVHLAVASDVAPVDPVDPAHHPAPQRAGADPPVARPRTAPGAVPGAVTEAVWVTGPDAGATVALTAGRHLVGRAAGCPVRCADADLEAHHALIEVDVHGRPVVVALGGHVGGPSVGRVAEATVETADEPSHVVHLGASTLRLGPLPTAASDGAGAPQPAQIRAGTVLRTPRPPRSGDPSPVAVPAELPPGSRRTTGLMPAAVALAGAGVMAALLHQPLFLVFAGIGALTAVVSWAAQVVGERRTRRRQVARAVADGQRFAEDLAAHHAALLARYRDSTMSLSRAVAAIEQPNTELWQRRATDDDLATVGLGLGALTVAATLDGALPTGDLRASRTVEAETVAARIDPGRHLALCGEAADTAAVARSILCQLMSMAGPADVRIVVVTESADRWAWLRGAPHVATPLGPAVVDDAGLTDLVNAGVGCSGRLVLVTDRAELLASRTGPLRRALGPSGSIVAAGGPPPSLLVVLPADHGIPQLCHAALTVGDHFHGRWVPDLAATSSVTVRLAGLSDRRAAALVETLSRFADPDDPLSSGGRIPDAVGLGDVLAGVGVDVTCPSSIAAGWVAGGADPRLSTPVGVSDDGLVEIDLTAEGPHALVAGTTGSGKSELLRSLVIGWAAMSSPEHLSFVLVDYKGGATFDPCAVLPHVAGVITDLDDRLASRALRSLHAELRRREAILRHHRAADLTELRRVTGTARLPRLVVVVDEFAALTAEQPAFLHALVGVAQRGRSLGIHLVLATQRPHGVISDDIRANTTLRLALRLLDRDDALDVVGDATPTTFGRAHPGRTMLRLGPDEHVVFQTAHGGAAGAGHRAAAQAVADAARLVGATTPPAPWHPPLPGRLDPPTAHDLGLVDDPEGQRVLELTWSAGSGHTLVAARHGMGVTSALRLLAEHVLRQGDADPAGAAVVTVVDGRGDPAWAALRSHPRCAGVITLGDGEGLHRAIGAALAVVDTYRDHVAAGDRTTPGVLIVDGLDVVRGALDTIETDDLRSALDAVVLHGSGAGVTVVAGTGRVGSLPAGVLAAFANIWVGHLADGHDAAAVGVRPDELPEPIAGRVVLAGCGLHAQLRPPGGITDPPTDPAGRSPLDPLPARVTTSRLDRACRLEHGWRLPVGLGFDHGDAVVEVPDGSHVLVVGPSRSGRTTALTTLAGAWQDAAPDSWTALLRPRHGAGDLERALDTMPDHGPRLVVVDDAELVDDPAGLLHRLAASRSPGLLILAAGAPEALRRLYGHWTTAVRGSRLGLLATAGQPADADLLGVQLPRRCPIRPRPGLMWLADNGRTTLVQVAERGPTRPDSWPAT